MTDNNQKSGETENGQIAPKDKSISRRDFLKVAGIAGVAIGAGVGVSGLIGACGGGETTTTTGSVTTTAAPSTTTTTAASTTTASAGPESGREVKVGVITPMTGIYAVFGIGDSWGLGLVNKHLGDSLVLGDGKKHKVTWVQKDTQSDTQRAAAVTGDLILSDKVDLLTVGGGPDTALPAADNAETLGCPLLGVNCPWQAWVFGRNKTLDTAEKWVYASLFGVEQATAGVVQVFDKIQSNKVVSLYLGNTTDTQAWLAPQFGIEDTLKAAKYTFAPYALFNQGTEDYSTLISGFKKAGAELNFGSNPGKDFSVFWQQCHQQGYRPKACIEVIGLSSYEDQVALGNAAYGLIVGFTWHKSWPFTDPITGMNCQQLADDYEAATNSMWNFNITGYARMGWAVDVLKRTKNIDDKESILEAIKTTNTELITGKIDLTSPVNPASLHVTPNIYKQPWGFGQIQQGTKWKVDIPLIAQIDAPEVKIDRDPVPLTYS
jgi:branched-chain amino acid transport system substrate-binding protein